MPVCACTSRRSLDRKPAERRRPSGFSLIAEDGNPLPGKPRVQSEVFMAAGKSYDVMINAPAAASQLFPSSTAQLSLSGNAVSRDSGMLAYISVNGAGPPGNQYGRRGSRRCLQAIFAGQTLTISDASKGVLANDTNILQRESVGPRPTQGSCL